MCFFFCFIQNSIPNLRKSGMGGFSLPLYVNPFEAVKQSDSQLNETTKKGE